MIQDFPVILLQHVFGRANALGRSNPNNFLFDHDILWIVNDILEALEPWEAV